MMSPGKVSAFQVIKGLDTVSVEVDSADFNLNLAALTLKLELLQHAGSFKSRGGFNNLLTRKVPPGEEVYERLWSGNPPEENEQKAK